MMLGGGRIASQIRGDSAIVSGCTVHVLWGCFVRHLVDDEVRVVLKALGVVRAQPYEVAGGDVPGWWSRGVRLHRLVQNTKADATTATTATATTATDASTLWRCREGQRHQRDGMEAAPDSGCIISLVPISPQPRLLGLVLDPVPHPHPDKVLELGREALPGPLEQRVR